MTNTHDAVDTPEDRGDVDGALTKFERDAQIVRYREMAHPVADIAEQFGLTPARVYQICRTAFTDDEEIDVKHKRWLENRRLDRLQAGLSANAESGNTFAVGAVLQVMSRRAKLNGLDMPIKIEVEGKANSSNVREALNNKLMALKAKLPSRAGDDAKLIEGSVEPSAPYPYIVGHEREADVVEETVEVPEPDPFEEVLTEDIYGEQGQFRS